MDPYHKMLLKMYEAASGRETADVDFVDLTKKAGYYPSIDSIVNHLKKEGWVTESRPNVLRLTHWGIAEARKTGTQRPDADRHIEKQAKQMLAETRDLSVKIEEFIAEPNDEHLKPIRTALDGLRSALAEIDKTRG